MPVIQVQSPLDAGLTAAGGSFDKQEANRQAAAQLELQTRAQQQQGEQFGQQQALAEKTEGARETEAGAAQLQEAKRDAANMAHQAREDARLAAKDKYERDADARAYRLELLKIESAAQIAAAKIAGATNVAQIRAAATEGAASIRAAATVQAAGMHEAGADVRAEHHEKIVKRGQDLTAQRAAAQRQLMDRMLGRRLETTRRGQDITARGQDIRSADTERGQDLLAKYRQALTAGTANKILATAALHVRDPRDPKKILTPPQEPQFPEMLKDFAGLTPADRAAFLSSAPNLSAETKQYLEAITPYLPGEIEDSSYNPDPLLNDSEDGE